MARLVINPTSASRREITLAGATLSIGRDPANDVVLPDTMVSRRHAVVELRGTQFFLRDCNSSNGSLVNGDRVSERGLKDGDLLAIGATRLLFRDGPEREAGEPSAKVVPHPSAARLECPACHAEHGVGDQFCRQCGGPLSAQVSAKLLCPACGSAVSRPARFCTSCGTTLPQGADAFAVTKPQPVMGDAPVAAAAPDAAAPAPDASAAANAPAVVALPKAASAAVPPPPLSAAPARPVRPAARSTAPVVVAGAGLRLIAALLDSCLVSVGQAVLVVPILLFWWSREVTGAVPFVPILLSLLVAGLALLLGALYYVYFWGVQGATPGKRAVGLAVVNVDGRGPIGVGAAMLRLAGYVLSALPLGIGFVLVPVTGRGLHDRMAGTVVVQRERV